MNPTVQLTNALLKEKMTDAVVFRRYLTAADDLNEIRQPGVYQCDGTGPANAPAHLTRFILTVTKASDGSNYLTQEIAANNGEICRRTWWYSAWLPWRRIVTEALT